MGILSFFSPGGSDQGNKFMGELGDVSRRAGRYAWENRSPVIRADESGFMPYQRTGLNVFAQLLRGRSSGDWSARGFNLPSSEDAVVGSALTQAAPNLFALQNENQQLPGQIVNQNLLNYLQSYNPMLQGGQFGQSRGPGLGFNMANSFLTGFGGSLGKSLGGGSGVAMGGVG